MGGEAWTLITILGPIVLAFAIAYAVIANRRRTRGEIARTEAGTKRLYEEQERVDAARHDEAKRD